MRFEAFTDSRTVLDQPAVLRQRMQEKVICSSPRWCHDPTWMRSITPSCKSAEKRAGQLKTIWL
ncbi:MAG: hypothetical protein ACUVSV_03755 [Armatimonadota bacterium]